MFVKLKMKKAYRIFTKLQFFLLFVRNVLIGNKMQDLAIITVKMYLTIKADLHLAYYLCVCVASKTDSLMYYIIPLANER